MKKYKLKINYSLKLVNLTKGLIFEFDEKLGFYSCGAQGFAKEFVEFNPDIFEELPILFYTEDFEDGSYPEKSCENCRYLNSGYNPYCKNSGISLCNSHDGELKGKAIYEGDKCWRINPVSMPLALENCYDEWTYNTSKPNVRYFSNEVNAKTYFNELTWKDKIKFKVGDRVVGNGISYKMIVGEIDYLNEQYVLFPEEGNGIIHFNKQEMFELYTEPKFEVGKWYFGINKQKETAYICYNGKDVLNYGFTWGRSWTNKFNLDADNIRNQKWELADMDEVKELLLSKAKKDYPIGTTISSLYLGGGKIASFHHWVDREDDAIWFSNGNMGLCVYRDGKWAETIDSPILTTTDGVKMYEGDDWVFVDECFGINVRYNLSKDMKLIPGYKIFESIEAAREWIKVNKPKSVTEKAEELGFRIGDKVWYSHKDYKNGEQVYVGEILTFANNNRGVIRVTTTLMSNVDEEGTTISINLVALTNKVAIHTPTEREFKFIKSKLHPRLACRTDKYICVNQGEDYSFYTCSNPKYLELTVDEYMKSIGEKPLFITEDNINIYKGMNSYTINIYDALNLISESTVYNSKTWYLRYFSTKQAAEDYIKSKEYPKIITEEGISLYGDDKCYGITDITDSSDLQVNFKFNYVNWNKRISDNRFKYFSELNNAKIYWHELQLKKLKK